MMPIPNKLVFYRNTEHWLTIRLLLEGLTWMVVTWLTSSLGWNKWTFRNIWCQQSHDRSGPWWINKPKQPNRLGCCKFFLIKSEAVAIPFQYQCLSQVNYLQAILEQVFFTAHPMGIYLLSFNLSSFLHQVRGKKKVAFKVPLKCCWENEWRHLEHDSQPLLSVKAGLFLLKNDQLISKR